MTDQTAYHMPAEDAPHQGTFLQWPVNRQVYKDGVFLRMVQRVIRDIANTISEFEPVYLLAAKTDQSLARRGLSDGVALWDVPTDDLWCRDAGPIFVMDAGGGLAIRQVQFNGWGNRQPHANDAQIARRVAERLGLPFLPSGLVGEGGGVEHDGHGTLIAHESSWVHENRNPGLSRADITDLLLAAFGADRMIWGKGVRNEDITDYHIDSLARFTGQDRILMNLPEVPDARDPFHTAALETHAALDAAGLAVEVIPEPTRARIRDAEFVASYANFYVCNGAVIAPQFGDARADEIARDALARHYPDQEIVILNVDPLGELGGGIHCATQQIPATAG